MKFKLIEKFKTLIKPKEVNVKMIIEISDNTTTKDLEAIMTWLQNQGYEPVIKGKGNGEVFIKANTEEEAEASSDDQVIKEKETKSK